MLKRIAITLACISMACCQSGPTGGGTSKGRSTNIASSFFTDQSVSMNASMAIAKDKELWRDSHISVMHHNNSLLLVGQTNTEANRLKTERIVSNLKGVERIYNQIEVNRPTPYSQRASDAWLTTQIKAKFFADKTIGFNDVKVITENGRVYLMGTLASNHQQQAVDIARNVDGVIEVLKIFDEPA